MFVQHLTPDTMRVCLIMHRRFLEIGERLARLPEESQRRLVPQIWQALQYLLAYQPGSEKIMVVPHCLNAHRYIDEFEQLVDHEEAAVAREHSIAAQGIPALAELFRVQRIMAVNEARARS